MITLHNKDFTTKYGTINSICEAFVEEERNGLFELSFIMLNTDSLFNYVKEDNIVVTSANDSLLNQKFRIYMTRKLMNNRVEVFARHISFDLMYDYIDNVSYTNQSCEYVLNQLFRNSNFSKHYKGYSDIINAQDYNMSMANVLEAIGGKEGSIIDTFGTGAEILRDNENIHILNKRGYDNDVVIEYKKNLTGFELEEDTTDLITRILPYAKYTDNETNEEILVKASYVDSPLIANYSHPFISAIDYSDKFEDDEIPTVSKLQELAKKEYKDNKVDIPKQNFKIEFIPLSKCVGYEGLEDNISLCDTVTIKDTRYNINTQAKVIKTTFNVLKNRYESMELGEPKTSLGDIIGNNDSTKGEKGDKGDKGEDGSIGDFPNSLPSVPVVTTKVYGFANIEISWTFENKVYYQYEVYASKTANFTPNSFNLVHKGQTSTYMYQAKPNETWYFKVCAINTHNNRTDFGTAYASTVKIDDLSNYVGEMAIGDALIGELNLGRGWYGELKGNYIDAKQLSVTNGNGIRTLDIDSYGNVNLNVASLKISSSDVATQTYTDTKASTAQTNAINSAKNTLNSTIANYYTKTQTDSKITVLNDSISLKAGKTEVTEALDKLETSSVNLLRYSNFTRENILNYWTYTTQGGHYLTIGSYSGGKNLVDDKHIKGKKVLNSRINIEESISSNSKYSSFCLGSSYRSITLEANQEYTFSYWVYLGGNSKSVHATVWSLPQDGSTSQAVGITESTTAYTGCFVRKTLTFTTSSESEYYIRFYHYYKDSLTSGESVVYIYQPMLSKGNKVVDWSESPLDIEEFTGEYIDSQIKDTKAEIKITTDNITQSVSSLTNTVSKKADNTTVNNLSSKVSTIETNIGNITSRVTNAEEEIVKTNEKAIKNYNNLLINSNIKNGTEGWRLTNLELNKSLNKSTTTSTLPVDRHTMIIGSNADNTAQTRFMDSTKFIVREGEKISLSYYIMSSKYVDHGRVYVLFTDSIKPIEEDNTFMSGFTWTGVSGSSSWVKKTETLTVPAGATRAFIRIRYQSLEKPSASDANTMAIASLMVSRGEDYPTWTNNAEDSYYSHEKRLSYAESKITDESITNTVKKSFYTKEETEKSITEKGYQTSSQVQQTVDKWEAKFQESGGYNLLYNGDFRRGTDKWSITSGFDVSTSNGNYSSPDRRGIAITGQSGATGSIYQNISSEYFNSIDYTLSGYIYISSTGVDDSSGGVFHYYVRLKYSDDTYTYHRCTWDKTNYNKWQLVDINFSRDTSKTLTEIRVVLSIQNTTRKVYLSQAMLQQGRTYMKWSPNSNEVYDGVTTIDKDGVKVSHSNGDYSQMSSSGFLRYVAGSGKSYHYLMSNGTVNVRNGQTATVTLPSEFKGKAFKVTVSAFKVNIVNGWKGIYDIDSFVSATDTTNGTFTVKGMVNDINGLEGTLDVSYVVIA